MWQLHTVFYDQNGLRRPVRSIVSICTDVQTKRCELLAQQGAHTFNAVPSPCSPAAKHTILHTNPCCDEIIHLFILNNRFPFCRWTRT